MKAADAETAGIDGNTGEDACKNHCLETGMQEAEAAQAMSFWGLGFKDSPIQREVAAGLPIDLLWAAQLHRWDWQG